LKCPRGRILNADEKNIKLEKTAAFYFILMDFVVQ